MKGCRCFLSCEKVRARLGDKNKFQPRLPLVVGLHEENTWNAKQAVHLRLLEDHLKAGGLGYAQAAMTCGLLLPCLFRNQPAQLKNTSSNGQRFSHLLGGFWNVRSRLVTALGALAFPDVAILRVQCLGVRGLAVQKNSKQSSALHDQADPRTGSTTPIVTEDRNPL